MTRITTIDYSFQTGSQSPEKNFSKCHRRTRTLSIASSPFILSLDISKTKAYPTSHISKASYGASGSFSPTTSESAYASLRSLAGAYSPRQRTLSDIVNLPKPLSPWTPMERNFIPDRNSLPQSRSSSSSPPGSPLSVKSISSSIPSISRTASSFSDDEIIPTPTHSKPPSIRTRAKTLSGPNTETGTGKLHPVLAACERNSPLSTRNKCSTCNKAGYDYPRCGNCNEMWCSRACRLRDGAKRHICPK